MSSREIRIGQLIAPFGPGSLYTDRFGTPLVIAGLDYWFHEERADGAIEPKTNEVEEFRFFEPRLSDLLGVAGFSRPPDYRWRTRDQSPPPNAGLTIPVLRFPTWYKDTVTSEMTRVHPTQRKLKRRTGGGRLQPIRFISVCGAGHLNEFPWKAWIGCECPGDGRLVLTDQGGSTLDSIRVKCKSCPTGSQGSKGKNLSGTTTRPSEDNQVTNFQRAGINCPGDRPWLGADASEPNCQSPLVGALINQTNIYLAKTVSALALPDLSIQDPTVSKLRSEIDSLPDIGVYKALWKRSRTDRAVSNVLGDLQELGTQATSDQVKDALNSLFDKNPVVSAGSIPTYPESDLAAFRREEYTILRGEVDDGERSPDLRIMASKVSPEVQPWLSRVRLIERLKEVRAFAGFDRLESTGGVLDGMPEIAMQQLFLNPPDVEESWLPGIDIYGEGIYVELSEEKLHEWQRMNKDWLQARLREDFIVRLAGISQTVPPDRPADWIWASRYMVVHTLAHILIDQLVFECGYSTASLRERIYVSSDDSAAMGAFLIYTAAGDGEGTLGGLVRLGRPERFGPVVERAITRASWCSADPVCSENTGGTGSRLANLSACHGCVLLPETSCETINHGLDRSLVVGTPSDRSVAFFNEFSAIL